MIFGRWQRRISTRKVFATLEDYGSHVPRRVTRSWQVGIRRNPQGKFFCMDTWLTPFLQCAFAMGEPGRHFHPSYRSMSRGCPIQTACQSRSFEGSGEPSVDTECPVEHKWDPWSQAADTQRLPVSRRKPWTGNEPSRRDSSGVIEAELRAYPNCGATFSVSSRMELTTCSCGIWPPWFMSRIRPVSPMRSRNSSMRSMTDSGEPKITRVRRNSS